MQSKVKHYLWHGLKGHVRRPQFSNAKAKAFSIAKAKALAFLLYKICLSVIL